MYVRKLLCRITPRYRQYLTSGIQFSLSPESLLCCEGAGGDDEEDVEYGRSNDGSDAHVALGDEDSNYGGEELRRGPARGHERGSSNVGADTQLDRKRDHFRIFPNIPC